MATTLAEARYILQYTAIFGLLFAALRWGAAPERVAAAVLVFQVISEFFYHEIFGAGVTLSEIDLGHAIMDGLAFAAFLALALQANRKYPLWLASFQLFALLTHLVREMAGEIQGQAYALLTLVPSYCMIVTLCCGILLHHRRSNQYGQYRSWRTS